MLEHGFSRSVTESLFICLCVVPCSSVFVLLSCTDLTDNTDIFARTRIFTEFHGILFISIRVFPCDPCSLFYSNTDFHGFSRNFIHLHPFNLCNPWGVLFCTDSTDYTEKELLTMVDNG